MSLMKRNWLAAAISAFMLLGAMPALPAYAEDDAETLSFENLEYQISEDGHVIITNCLQNETNCNVPAEIDGAPVTEIAGSAFSECYFLESVTLPESIDTIGRQAFSACTALEWIYMPEEITSMGAGVFDGCTSLRDIVLPTGITELPEATFYECTSLETVIVGEGTEVIGPECFYGCTSLTAAKLPESLTTIGDYAFENCSSMLLMEIPENMVNIGKYVFLGCSSLDEFAVDENNEMFCDVDGVLFTKDMVTLVRYPEAIENSEYTVPDGCTQLANGCFVDAVHLTSVDLNQATVYGMDVFFRCTGLKEITFPEGTTELGAYMMSYCSSLEKVNFPSTLKTVGNYTFHTCAGLTEITVPEGVETIGQYSFFNCIALKKLSLPDTITSIGDGAFGYYAESEDTEPIKVPGFVVDYRNNKAIYEFVKLYDLEGTGTYSGRIWTTVGIIAGAVLIVGAIVLLIVRIVNANKIKPVKGGRKGSETKRPDRNNKKKG